MPARRGAGGPIPTSRNLGGVTWLSGLPGLILLPRLAGLPWTVEIPGMCSYRKDCRGPPYPASLMSHLLQKEKKATGISTSGAGGWGGFILSQQPWFLTDCFHNKMAKKPTSNQTTFPPHRTAPQRPAARLPGQGRSQCWGTVDQNRLPWPGPLA